MLEPSSVSQWLEGLEDGGGEAKAKLWGRYYARLVGLARQRLRGAPRRAADEEDVAAEAFERFFRGAEAGRFPRLDDRDDLWRILVRLVEDRAADLRRHESRQRRGGGEVRGDSAFEGGLDRVAEQGPTPAFAAEVAEEVGRLLGRLGGELRRVAVLKMEGHTNAEVAAELGVAVATVERKLAMIRQRWSDRGG